MRDDLRPSDTAEWQGERGIQRGLALAAGGARGAYQAGALLALSEMDVRFAVVAGTSIGALNGAFYAQGDGSPTHLVELVRRWRAAPRMNLLQLNGPTVLGALVNTRFGILDPKPLEEMLDRWLDYEAICRSPVDLYIAALPATVTLLDVLTGPWRTPSYFRARDLGPDELRRLLLAAAAIPFVFPAATVMGHPHADAALADPLPVRPLFSAGLREITSIFLADDVIQNRWDYPGCTLEQIRPSVDIASWRSLFDFSGAHIDGLIELGYRDATASRAEVVGICSQLSGLESLGRANLKLAIALFEKDPSQ